MNTGHDENAQIRDIIRRYQTPQQLRNAINVLRFMLVSPGINMQDRDQQQRQIVLYNRALQEMTTGTSMSEATGETGTTGFGRRRKSRRRTRSRSRKHRKSRSRSHHRK